MFEKIKSVQNITRVHNNITYTQLAAKAYLVSKHKLRIGGAAADLLETVASPICDVGPYCTEILIYELIVNKFKLQSTKRHRVGIGDSQVTLHS